MDTTQLYKQIVNDIKNRIIAGYLKPGERLPSENELLDIYNASKTTISKSLTILANEGYICTVPRVGNYVSQPEEDRYYLSYCDVEDLDNLWNKADIFNLETVKQNNQYYGNKLSVSKIFYLDNTVTCLDYKTIYYNGNHTFNKSNLLNSTLLDILSIINNLIKVKKQITIEAMRCTEEINKLMQVSPNDTLLKISRKYSNDSDIIFGESISYFLKDYMSLICKN